MLSPALPRVKDRRHELKGKMKKIKVTICTGTACFVMGASELMLLMEKLPEDLKDMVELSGSTCMGECKGSKNGRPPYVKIDDEVVHSANLAEVISRIEDIAAQRMAEGQGGADA